MAFEAEINKERDMFQLLTSNHLKSSLPSKEINCLILNQLSVALHFILKQDWVKTVFQIEELTIIQNLMENRLRHARGPIQFTESVTFILDRKIISMF